MDVWIRNDCPHPDLEEATLRSRALAALRLLDCDADAELSVWLCADAAIQELHRDYFGLDSPTNVISFAQREGEFAELEPELLGDVVISAETAARDAAEAGNALIDEVTFLLVHGLLHLLGYDHEGPAAHRAAEMEAKEVALYRAVLDEAG